MARLKRPQREELADLEGLLASGLITSWRTAIDGGAHIGGWTRALAARFAYVHAFEPAPDTFSLLEEYTADLPNVTRHRMALLDFRCRVRVTTPEERRALTARYVIPSISGDATATTVDRLRLKDLDLLKLDVEGAEVPALLGALETLRRCKPFVIVEEFGHGHRFGLKEGDAESLLCDLGYHRVWTAGPNLGFKMRDDL